MIICTPHAPEAIGPYSQAVISGNLVFISGCCPFRAADGSVNGSSIEEQARQAMSNLKAIVESAGTDMDSVVKTTCFISDLNNFQTFNSVYRPVQSGKSSFIHSSVRKKSAGNPLTGA
ncbi:Rid family detoxifying hydrolase [Salmonella enterica]|nr:YjgF-family lipoprotein [Salmonella enterica subsp. enterica serovar Hartford str. CFSAN001075]